MPPRASDERTTRINAWQAIIVTLITALAGIVGAVISTIAHKNSEPPSSSATPAPPPTQHYLTITSVESGSDSPYVGVRIVAEVNGQPYSYPSRMVWNSLDPNMPSEAFPLPVGQNEYSIRFEAFARRRDDKTDHLMNQEQHRIPVDALPVSRDYRFFRVESDAGGREFTRSPPSPRLSEQLQVKYDVR